MGTTARRTVLLTLCVALSVAACTGEDAPDDDPTAGDHTEDATAPASDVSEVVDAPRGRLQLSGFVERTNSEAVATLHAIAITDGGLLEAEIEWTSQRSRGNRLGESAVLAIDDLGNVHHAARPDDNPQFDIDGDQRMLGVIQFEGRIDPDANRVNIGFNQGSRNRSGDVTAWTATADGGCCRIPQVSWFDVPLPGVGLEAEAVRVAAEAGAVELDDEPQEGERAIGVTVAVTAVEVDPGDNATLVTIEAVNGSDRRVRITNRTPQLGDDAGRSYDFRADPDASLRELVALEPGEEATAVLVFDGVPDPDASTLSLTLNGLDGSSRTAPRFDFGDLPVPSPS